MGTMLAPGDHLPHLTLTTVTGDRIAYRDLWQRRNVAIVSTPDADRAQAFADAAAEFAKRNAVCIATHQILDVPPCPGVVIADRWGEIVHVAREVPAVEDVLEWLDHVELRCPECEGEAR
jgi:peroxiredoxin